jgi:hypothetical protein
MHVTQIFGDNQRINNKILPVSEDKLTQSMRSRKREGNVAGSRPLAMSKPVPESVVIDTEIAAMI